MQDLKITRTTHINVAISRTQLDNILRGHVGAPMDAVVRYNAAVGDMEIEWEVPDRNPDRDSTIVHKHILPIVEDEIDDRDLED